MGEVPISKARLEELSRGLSPEARVILDRWVMNLELEEGPEQEPEEVLAGFEELPQSQRDQLLAISGEIQKGFDRRIKEDEAFVGLSERAMEVHDRAAELEPQKINEQSTLSDAIEVLKAHGEPVPFSEEELHIEVEVPAPDEDADWIAIPESEMPADENGIPTRLGAPDGFGIEDPDGKLIKLYPRQAAAMRVLGKQFPYRRYIEDSLEDLENHKQEYMKELKALGAFEDSEVEQMASKMASTSAHNAYLFGLATTVKAVPDPQGLIDYHKGKKTKAAKRYKEHLRKTAEPIIKERMHEVLEEMIQEGIFEVVPGGEAGGQQIRPGPNYEKAKQERDLD